MTILLLQLIIKIEDENEIAPEFEESAYNAYIPDSTGPGVSVAQVRAVDQDTAGSVTYRISSGNSAGELEVFVIGSLETNIYRTYFFTPLK